MAGPIVPFTVRFRRGQQGVVATYTLEALANKGISMPRQTAARRCEERTPFVVSEWVECLFIDAPCITWQ